MMFLTPETERFLFRFLKIQEFFFFTFELVCIFLVSSHNTSPMVTIIESRQKRLN